MNNVMKTHLDDRAVLSITGSDARPLLQGLVTVDLDRLSDNGNVFGALLAPQGKIQFDFFIHALNGDLWIDIDKARAQDFLKRMMLYKLRSDVQFTDVSDTYFVVAQWGDNAQGAADARLSSLGTRQIVETLPAFNANGQEYHAHRIQLGVPEAGKDFAYDDIFPHDAMMDALHGVDFGKGCYVGQEVVSRVQHRGTARKRFYHLASSTPLPEFGSAVMVGDKAVGTLGSSVGGNALALLRMDRLDNAEETVTVGGLAVQPSLPDYFNTFAHVK